MLIAKLYGKKVILNYHSGHAEDHLTRWRRTAIPLMRLADSIIVPSDYLVDVFAGFGLRASAIFNTVETSNFRFRKRSNLRPIFLANRNLEALYNVGLVLRAFAIIQQSFPEASLTVAGEGSERGALETLAGKLDLRDTDFVGRVSPEQMPALYDEADIYLNGSDVDNMPLSILEAFAAGVPVVTTNAGGIPYIVSDGETGLLVERGDDKAMAASAIRLLEDNALAAKIIRAAHEECDKYKWAVVRDEWLKVYHQLGARAEKDVSPDEQVSIDGTRVRTRG
jgi:glycosyltransferase involved in cell wall biosynthesis